MSHIKTLETFKNVKANKTTVNAYQKPGTSWENVIGSNITYTPASNSSFVVYEYMTVARHFDVVSNIDFKLQFGSDINNLGNITTNNVGYFYSIGPNSGSSSYFNGPINFKFLIDTSLWSGEKVIVLQAKNKSTNEEGVLHSAYGSSTETYFNPFVIIYSI